ncbi:PAN-complex poly(A)-binding subunit PAN3 [Sporobolomyces salmoneus]|uniref:PAN-complex poly(A)-binding subunit PAN3 n=1 Tax=Sporobolomyces salmoneus TaxID=183962 RepID=UPI00316CF3CA
MPGPPTHSGGGSSAIPIAPPSAPASPAPPSANASTLSVASAAKAAVFVPGGANTNSSNLSAAGGASALTTGAAEFVPRRTVTPALSEDAPYFTPSGTTTTAQEQQEQQQPEEIEASAEGMAEYYQQAMDLNAPEYRQTPSQDPSSSTMNPYVNYSHSLAPPGQNGGLPSSTGTSATAQAAAEAAYYNNGMHLGGGMHHLSHLNHGMGFVRQPLQYHLYHPLPSTRPHHPHSALSRSSAAHSPTTTFFLPPALHISLNQKSEATQSTPPLDLSLPDEVGGYTGLTPLDSSPAPSSSAPLPNGSGFAGYKSTVYKAWKETEGRCYVLRRVEGFRLPHEQAIACVEKWTRVRHPGLVGVREAFTTRAFSDQSIIFVYDFHPCSQTLYEAHLSPSATLPPNPWSTPSPLTHTPFRGPRSTPLPNSSSSSSSPAHNGGAGGPPSLPERVLWSYIVQIGSALKCVHQNGLAMRSIEVNRVLVTGKNRVRLGGASVMDCLTWDGGQNTSGYQQEDLLSFGKLIISLACGSPSAVHNLPKSVDHISRMYSPDLKNVVLYLLSKPGPRKTIEEVMALMSTRVVDELNSSLVAEDTIERELMRELENGRLVRLLCKFGFINERPEFDHDPRWAETGDRYLIKLFRDYVFHQVDESGRPVTDLSHVLTQLNKLDSGVEEKIMLVSRDEASCLIVSYRELKNAIEGAYADLSRTG